MPNSSSTLAKVFILIGQWDNLAISILVYFSLFHFFVSLKEWCLPMDKQALGRYSKHVKAILRAWHHSLGCLQSCKNIQAILPFPSS